MSIIHFQSVIAAAVPGGRLIQFLAANTGSVTSSATSINITVNFGDEAGSDRLLVACLFSEGTVANALSSMKYDGVTMSLFGFGLFEDRGTQACRCRNAYLLDADLPATSGNKTFNFSVLANPGLDGHMVTLMLFKGVDQDTPWGVDTQFRAFNETPPFDFLVPVINDQTTDIDPSKDYVGVLNVGLCDGTGTYAAGDIIEASGGSQIQFESELNQRNAPGGACRAGYIYIPDASESWLVEMNNGASSQIDGMSDVISTLIPKFGSTALTTSITRGDAVVKTKTKQKKTVDIRAFGFDAGSDAWAYAPGYGSVATGTYTDGTSTTRTIDSCNYLDGGPNPRVTFVLDGTSIPNVDATFHSIRVGTRFYARANADTYIASVDGGTLWEWEDSTNPFAAGGNTFHVRLL